MQCPELLPKCDVMAGAKCKNNVGSYTCLCPEFTSGDAFMVIDSVVLRRDDDNENDNESNGKYIGAPDGYQGGIGCKDTSRPIIDILGPNPKIFQTCKYDGLNGFTRRDNKKEIKSRGDEGRNSKDLVESKRKAYEQKMKYMIQSTAGAELCATHTRTHPHPNHCVHAIDKTHKGEVDLSSSVIVGDPVSFSSSPFEWRVPYNVIDNAGNAANTVWRDVLVEEVDLASMEQIIRNEVLADRDREIKEAVQSALAEERMTNKSSSSNSNNNKKKITCPSCAQCSIGGTNESSYVDSTDCQIICDKRIQKQVDSTCLNTIVYYKRFVVRYLPLWVTGAWNSFKVLPSPALSLIILGCSIFFAFLLLIRSILAPVLRMKRTKRNWYYFSPDDNQREQNMLDSVTYYHSPQLESLKNRKESRQISYDDTSNATGMTNEIGCKSSIDGTNCGYSGIFSTPRCGEKRQEFFSPQSSTDDNSIYQNMSPITPSRPAHEVDGQYGTLYSR